MIRRSFIKIGGDLAIDLANTSAPEEAGAGRLESWRDLVDFLELRDAVTREEGSALRALGEREAHACAAAFDRALELRGTVRAILEALAARHPLQAGWVTVVNQALGWGTGASRLVRQGRGWRLAFASTLTEPLRALAPIARSAADLIAQGRGALVRKCANPRCVLYFRDTSRTRRRRWCSMAVCGNRMKVAAHTRRHGRRRSG
ncbi:MAG TPA: CGNR zinc finger domain-containing protein [Methylomirabilota bacterium]|nr:CGNR zinc finger domain-containing protein [Methylomirabilota bacterium]